MFQSKIIIPKQMYDVVCVDPVGKVSFQMLNSGFHLLFQYPYITPILSQALNP